MVVGVDPDRVHGLHAGVGHRLDGGEVPAARHQRRDDLLAPRADGDAVEDLVARRAPSRRCGRSCASRATSCRRPRAPLSARTYSARNGIRSVSLVEAAGQRVEDLLELLLLGAPEPDVAREQLGVAAVADDELDLAVGVLGASADHAELEQQLLHVAGELLAARRVRDLDRVLARGTTRSRRPRTAPAGTPASRRPAPRHTNSGTRLSALFLPDRARPADSPTSARCPGRRARAASCPTAALASRRSACPRRPRRTQSTTASKYARSVLLNPARVRTRPSLRRPIAPARNAASSSCCGRRRRCVAVDVTRHDHARARLDLLEQLPLEHRHAGDLLEAEHRVVVGAGDLEALARAQPQRRVVAAVEELRRPDRVAVAVEHLEVDVDLGVRLRRRRARRCARVEPSASRTRVAHVKQYRIAAGRSLGSGVPKFPWPSMSG